MNPKNYPQDHNAGNLGDLLKHLWLLRLLDVVLEKIRPRMVAYFESHAGAGLYPIDEKRIRQILSDKARISRRLKNPDSIWEGFDRLNSKILNGVYLGSFPLVLHQLAEWKSEKKGRAVKGKIWESHPIALKRIREFQCALIPAALSKDIEILERDSTPQSFIEDIQRNVREGYTVLWLCDPYWGTSKEADKAWWSLLSGLKKTHGILFGYVGGNSFKRGDAKFDFQKVIALPKKTLPTHYWIPDNTCAYGLFLTGEAERALRSADAS